MKQPLPTSPRPGVALLERPGGLAHACLLFSMGGFMGENFWLRGRGTKASHLCLGCGQSQVPGGASGGEGPLCIPPAFLNSEHLPLGLNPLTLASSGASAPDCGLTQRLLRQDSVLIPWCLLSSHINLCRPSALYYKSLQRRRRYWDPVLFASLGPRWHSA